MPLPRQSRKTGQSRQRPRFAQFLSLNSEKPFCHSSHRLSEYIEPCENTSRSIFGQAEIRPSIRTDAILIPARHINGVSRTSHSYLPKYPSQLNVSLVPVLLLSLFSLINSIKRMNSSLSRNISGSFAARPMGITVNNLHCLTPIEDKILKISSSLPIFFLVTQLTTSKFIRFSPAAMEIAERVENKSLSCRASNRVPLRDRPG